MVELENNSGLTHSAPIACRQRLGPFEMTAFGVCPTVSVPPLNRVYRSWNSKRRRNHDCIDTPSSLVHIVASSSVQLPEMLTLTLRSSGLAFAADIFNVIR